MQQTNSVAVLATQFSQTDRRALSQAWYSALHLADHTPLPPRAVRASAAGSTARGTPQPGLTARGAPPERDAGYARGGHAAMRTAISPRRDASAGTAERCIPTELARRIERVLAHRTPRRGAASFTVRAAGGRVHLVVRSDGARTRVVAVCAPPLRERVERALAHVRFALAGSGVRAEAA
jgi:hypothetical protein